MLKAVTIESGFESTVIIDNTDFDQQQCYKQLRLSAPSAGAIVTFVGLVRDYTHNHDTVVAIELQQYEGMTRMLIDNIIHQAQQRWQLAAVQVVHRIGYIKAQEQIVYVGVASAHRGDAFSACEFIMDYLKTEATLWKKEWTRAGKVEDDNQQQLTAQWLDCKSKDQQALKKWQL